MRHLSPRRRAAVLAGSGVVILGALAPVMLRAGAPGIASPAEFALGFAVGLASVALAALVVVRLRRR